MTKQKQKNKIYLCQRRNYPCGNAGCCINRFWFSAYGNEEQIKGCSFNAIGPHHLTGLPESNSSKICVGYRHFISLWNLNVYIKVILNKKNQRAISSFIFVSHCPNCEFVLVRFILSLPWKKFRANPMSFRLLSDYKVVSSSTHKTQSIGINTLSSVHHILNLMQSYSSPHFLAQAALAGAPGGRALSSCPFPSSPLLPPPSPSGSELLGSSRWGGEEWRGEEGWKDDLRAITPTV